MRPILLSACVVLGLFSCAARAHFALVYPPARYTGVSELFGRPCGREPDTGRANVTTVSAGSTLTVRWDNTVVHPGHFRISFDADGQNFSIPAAVDDFYTDPNVLADDIPSAPSGAATQTFDISLPDIECDHCTLQVLQVLTDHAPYTTDENSDDLHFRCADLVLVRDTIFADGFD